MKLETLIYLRVCLLCCTDKVLSIQFNQLIFFPLLIALVLLHWFIYICVCVTFRCLFDLSSSSSLSVIAHCSCRIVPVESTSIKNSLFDTRFNYKSLCNYRLVNVAFLFFLVTLYHIFSQKLEIDWFALLHVRCVGLFLIT
jgi:hypothetical protein